MSIVSAIIALAALTGGVASNLVANDIQAKLGPTGKWVVWVIFMVASIVAIVAAFLGTDSSKTPLPESSISELPLNAGATIVNVNATRGAGEGKAKDFIIVTGDKNVTISDSQVHGYMIGRQEIHKQIIEAPPPINALHQMPSPPHDFTGREKELSELLDAHEHGDYLIIGVQGLGGAGKTALALKLAERLKPRFPDAQFYLDLRGANPQPIPVTDALAHVIRAYHPNAQMPNDEASLQVLYRSALDGKRAIVLMDNATDRTQVEPLIPPASCLLLVTSRQHFTLPGIFRQYLESMPLAEAHDMLLKIAPRIGDQAGEIARHCGYLPLALRIAASLLEENRNLSVADYTQRLADERRRLEMLEREDQSVATSLGLSYELLSEELRGLWRALAVFPSTFELDGAAAIWELEHDSAQTALSKLVRYSLVDWIERTARYRLHDLVRLFVKQQMSDAELAATSRRHAIHYCSVLAEANGLCEMGGEAIKAGTDLFDAEWVNIQAGQVWAGDHAETSLFATLLCLDYPNSGIPLLSLRQPPHECIRWCETMLLVSRRVKLPSDEMHALGNLGAAWAKLGETRKAIKFFEQSLLIARETGDRKSEGMTLNNLGLACAELGETRKAIEFFGQSLIIARQIGNRGEEGRALCHMGLAWSKLGETRKAIEFSEQSLIIVRETGAREGECVTLRNLGAGYAELGETRKAIEFFEQSLLIAREFGYHGEEGRALGTLGAAYRDLGETRKAIEFFEQSLVIAREIGDRSIEGLALWELSLSMNKIGQRAGAIAQAEAALKIYDEIESHYAYEVRQKLAEWQNQT